MNGYTHTPIMLGPCMAMLLPERGGLFVDCTLGGGGHSEAILERLPQTRSRLIGIDRDSDAILAASERLKCFAEHFVCVRGNFFDIKKILTDEKADGMLVDLGVSSYQLDEPARGFAYQHDAKLDMRMDTSQKLCAADVVNGYSEAELTRIFREYGEEKWAVRIAQFIVAARGKKSVETTFELVEIIKAAIPAGARREGPHPAKRCFQAIRIEVNGELEQLSGALEDMVHSLKRGGRLAVITFHSLEDRIVKQTFARLEKPCVCPPKSPICICGKTPVVRSIARKPIVASETELAQNPRARSAKLRGVEKV